MLSANVISFISPLIIFVMQRKLKEINRHLVVQCSSTHQIFVIDYHLTISGHLIYLWHGSITVERWEAYSSFLEHAAIWILCHSSEGAVAL